MFKQPRLEEVVHSLAPGGFRAPLDKEVRTIRRRAVAVGTLFLLCALVGVIAGVGAAGFHFLLELSQNVFLDGLAGFRQPVPLGEVPLFAPTDRPFSRWILFLLPAAGGLLSGILIYKLAPEAEGHGTDSVIDAFHNRDGAIRLRVPFVKIVASAITIGTGGSAGREGPIAQIGAGLGSNIARWLGLTPAQCRVIMAAGLGAGIGAIFRAPLAGALFAAEVLYRDMEFEYEVIAPAILSSIIAYSTFGMFFGWDPLFYTPDFVLSTPFELAPYLILAVVVAMGGRLYVQVFYGFRDLFRKIPIPVWTKPALGGFFVGCIGLFYPQVLSTGFGVVQNAIQGTEGATLLLIVAVAKIFATSLTVATGGSGGVFGPAVVIGGCLGGAVGLYAHDWMPGLVPQPGAFAMVGMAGFFAAAAAVPVSTVIMVSEMTGNYQLLVPTMLVCMLGVLLVRKHTIYENQLRTRADSPLVRRAMLRSVMERLRVSDLLHADKGEVPGPLDENAPLTVVLERLASTEHTCLPVLDATGKVSGSVTLDRVTHALGSSLNSHDVKARDLAVPAVSVRPDQSLLEAIHEMVTHHRHEVLVVSEQPAPAIVGVLTSDDINVVYEQCHEPDEAVENVYRQLLGTRRKRRVKAVGG